MLKMVSYTVYLYWACAKYSFDPLKIDVIAVIIVARIFEEGSRTEYSTQEIRQF